MTRTITLAALLSLVTHGAIAAVEFRVEVTTTSASVATGGLVTFRTTVRNAGTTTSPAYTLNLGVERGRFITSDESTCVLSDPSNAQCGFAGLGAGESRTLTFSARASNGIADVGQLLVGRATIITVIPDDEPVFLRADARVPITMSPAQLDLGIALLGRPAGAAPLGTLEIVVDVANGGPSTAAPAVVTVSISFNPVNLIGTDAPWFCSASSTFAGTTVVCSTPQLGAGQRLPLTFRVDVPLARTYTIAARVWTDDATDLDSANDTGSQVVQTGVASDFARILIPLMVSETPGARATWTSELWALTRQNATLVVCRAVCPADPNNADRPRPNATERLWPFGSGGSAPHGAMLYIEKPLAADVTFSSRLFSSRTSAARGVELPIVRESQFRNTRLVIPAVVLDPNHRFKLRIYEPDATPNSGVIVRLFDHDLSRVIAERTLPLATRAETVLGTTLPGYPGYAEVDDIFPTTEVREVGIEIVALTTGMRLWAFVSATENEGEHVTLVTPQ